VIAVAANGLGDMFAHPFMRNAFVGGTGIAAAAGLVGYFVVLRAQVFTGDALSHVAFTGAIAALAAGIDARVGLFAATIAIGVAIALLGQRGQADDVVIGSVFAWILGLGVLFLTLYTTSRSTTNGAAGVNVLFGSIFGLDPSAARIAALIGAGVIAAVIGIGRPLLFASIDPDVAAARGLPVRALGVGLLALVGATAAEATQAVGALLLLGLLAAPAGAAHRLTARPFRAMWLSALLATIAMWAGLTTSYLAPRIPPSFAIITATTAIYVLALAAGTARTRRSSAAGRTPTASTTAVR
jgi:zinc/manganese transport system permease protein